MTTGDSRNASPMTDQSVSELLNQLSEQTSRLVRQELDLAKAELTVKGKQAGLGAGMFGAAGLVGAYAVGALTAAIVMAISLAVAGWLAALIVAVAYGAIAGVLALSGKTKLKQSAPLVPERTVQTLKEDVEVTKQRAQEGRR
jgi:MFS family permease